MNWRRSFLIAGLSLVLLVGVSCTGIDNTPTGIPDGQVEQPAQDLGSILDDLDEGLDDLGGTLGGALDGVLEITNLLTCKEQTYEVTRETIGPNGGIIEVGEHVLVIPRGALSKKVKIKAEQMRGRTNSVRFSPEGLTFEKHALLTMSYRNCVPVPLPKTIVYTTEKFKVLEVLRSLDLFRKRTVTAPIDHFSRYAVAY